MRTQTKKTHINTYHKIAHIRRWHYINDCIQYHKNGQGLVFNCQLVTALVSMDGFQPNHTFMDKQDESSKYACVLCMRVNARIPNDETLTYLFFYIYFVVAFIQVKEQFLLSFILTMRMGWGMIVRPTYRNMPHFGWMQTLIKMFLRISINMISVFFCFFLIKYRPEVHKYHFGVG